MGIGENSWFFFLSYLLICFSLNAHLSNGADTISVGQSLSGNQTIISDGGNFELGFFTPGKSQNYYIGIWYKKIPAQTVVWVANRDRPLSDPSSWELKIMDGNLVLVNQTKFPIWSTNLISAPSNSIETVLLDNGKLVLRDGPNSSTSIWESFDHPTDTWLPGGKLGLDKRTNQTQLITSWISEEDPSPGIFSLSLSIDTSGSSQFILIWNRSERYWSSGTWNGHNFRLLPEMTLSHFFNFSYIDNANESYLTYSLYNTSILSRQKLDFSGQIKQFLWLENTQEWNIFWNQPREQCEVHAFCGPFGKCNQKNMPFCECIQGFEERSPKDWNLSDWSGGCVRKTSLHCGNTTLPNGEKDKFVLSPKMRLPVNNLSLAVGSTEGCELACLNNCSCTAYSYGSGGCSIWVGDLLNLQQFSDDDSEGDDLFIRLAASENLNSKKGTTTWVIVGTVAGAVALLVFFLVLIWEWWRKRSVGMSKAVEGSLVPFRYRDLQSVTNNFAEKLGGGGFGSVFKGTLPDSTVIAVKKLEGLSQGEKQFRSEVSTIGTIQHVNLIRLRGFCSEGTERLLVYDYMPNGSLNSHLFHQNDSNILDWNLRYQIALGTARGLTYLHEKCRDCIIHCDIKPENILLDTEFCPKVADFGLAKLVGREFSRVLTTMRGTRGYLAPEWISGVAITAKADVYSYGMMLLELISGRRNSEQSEDRKIDYFPTWAANKLNEGEDVLSLLDQRLEGNANVEELTRACRVACWCIQDDEAHRPSMGQVVQILEGVLEVNVPPIPRTLQELADCQENTDFFIEPSSNQSSKPQE